MLNETPEFYRPHILDKQQVLRPDATYPDFTKLTNQLTDSILKSNILISTHQGETDIRQPQFKNVKSDLVREVADVIRLKTAQVIPGSTEAIRVNRFTRAYLSALTEPNTANQYSLTQDSKGKNSQKNPLFRSIHKDEYLGLLALSLELAQQPKLAEKLSISVGFGGSDQEDVNVRLPAYILPGLQILENFKRIGTAEGSLSFMPRLRVFFAPHTAIEVNGEKMDAHAILENQQHMEMYLRAYVHRFHPDVEEYVTYEVDSPWGEHDQLTTLALCYFADLISQATDERIIKTLAELGQRGQNNGGNMGKDFSHMYAAAHPLLFKDGLSHPGSMFAESEKPLFSISIGGWPERWFNEIRAFLREHSQIEHLPTYVDEGDSAVRDWMDSVRESRSNHVPIITETELHDADKPLSSIKGLVKTGRSPVYYRSSADIGVRETDGSLRERLRAKRTEIENSTVPKDKRAAELSILQGVEYEIEQLIGDAGGEKPLMEFISEISSSL